MRIEICGGIASGKTTLAGLFELSRWDILFEDFERNPFWEAFYKNPGRFIFETEVSFLLQHYHQIKAEAPPSGVFVCDYSFVLDQAYADIGLDGSKHNTFTQVHQEIRDEIGTPDVVVCLECDAEEELRRIRNRGRSEEESIDLEFLSALNEAVYGRFDELKASTPSHVINSTDRDFAHFEEEQTRVVRELQTKISEVQDTNSWE